VTARKVSPLLLLAGLAAALMPPEPRAELGPMPLGPPPRRPPFPRERFGCGAVLPAAAASGGSHSKATCVDESCPHHGPMLRKLARRAARARRSA
jgi:hypothetical protein